MSGSLVDFIDFDPEFNASNVVRMKRNEDDLRSVRPRRWLVDYAQQQCGAQLSSNHFPFSARKRDRPEDDDS